MKKAKQGEITVTFDEQFHSYIDNLNRKYSSVTAFVKSLFPKFDGDSTAVRVAIREGTTKEAILERWKQAGVEACGNGTRAHLLAESIFRGAALPEPRDESERVRFSCVWNACDMLAKQWQFFMCEWIVFDPNWMIAGTTDLVMVDPAVASPGKVWILDWKTNKEIVRENKYKSFALPPLGHVPNINSAQYAFQLRLYERIIQRNALLPNRDGLPPETDCAIIHIPPGTETPEFIPVPRLDAELEKVLP